MDASASGVAAEVISDSKILAMSAKRAAERELFEKQRQELEAQAAKNRVGKIEEKFSSNVNDLEQQLKADTIGLVTLSDFQKKRETIQKLKEEEMVKKQQSLASSSSAPSGTKTARAGAASSKGPKLSFDMYGEDGEDGGSGEVEQDVRPAKKKKMGKDPSVDTSFLPDQEREAQRQKEAEKLRLQWLDDQERIKSEAPSAQLSQFTDNGLALELSNSRQLSFFPSGFPVIEELISITYSYWDGQGHRRTVRIPKGTTVEKFLVLVQREFKELQKFSVDNLMFIKEDLIIPSSYSFYDLIVTKARGKSGPLFDFDVHEDIRLVNDASKEKEESHAAKVVERRWYERTKHIFPQSRWEIFDPSVVRDKYTIHGDEVN